MSGLIKRAAGLFLEPEGVVRPAPPAPPTPSALPTPARRGLRARRTAAVPAAARRIAVVLGSGSEASPVALVLAAELRARAQADCALVGDWCGEPPPAPGSGSGSGSRAARRLAERLEARGLAARPQGRAVRLPLPAAPGAAAGDWARAIAAAGCPAVLALAGPRSEAFDPLLEDGDLVVVVTAADGCPELAALALDGLRGLRAPVVGCRPIPRAVARLAAASSLTTARVLGPEVLGVAGAAT